MFILTPELIEYMDRHELVFTGFTKDGALGVWPNPRLYPNPSPAQIAAIATLPPVPVPAPSPAPAIGPTDKVRVPLAQALEIAQAIFIALKAACTRMQIAGSIRRQQALVADAEILAISDGERLHTLTDQMLARGQLTYRLDKLGRKAWGEAYRRAWWALPGGGRFPLDLFIVAPTQWGGALTIRTGCAEFSHALVTCRGATAPHGNELVPGLRPRELQVDSYRIIDQSTGEILDTPEEEDFFRALGIKCFDPRLRTLALARQLAAR